MGIQLNGITGDAIIPGDVGIGGTLTYEDVTNIDSVGIITARDGIRVTGGKVGINSAAPNTRLDVIHSYVNRTWTPPSSGTALFERNGENRVVIVANSKSQIDFADASDDNAGYIRYDHSDNSMSFRTNGVDNRLRIDSAGNTKLTGAGSTSILSLFVDDTTAYNANATDGQITAGATLFIENDGNANNTINQIVMQSRTGYGYNRIVATGGSSPAMAFCVNNAEKLRITHMGRIGIGTDNPSSLVQLHATGRIRTDDRFNITKAANGTILNYDRTSVGSIFIIDNLSDESNSRMRIRNTVGSIAYNSALSDRTVKKNFESWDENVLDTFKNLNPQKFNFIREEDGTEKTKGFIAQDLADSFPEAYNKGDEENAVYYFNPSGMVVYLMKAVQELTAENTALKARLDAGGL